MTARNSATKTIAAPQAKTKVAASIPHDDKSRKADVTEDDGVFAEAMKRYSEAQDSLLRFFKAPSWKRTLVAVVSAFLVGAGVGWVVGTLLEWLMVGALALAVPTFLIMLVYVLGICIAIYYGGKWGARVGGAILTGEADERALAAYDATKSLLSKLNPFGRRTIAA